MTSQYDVMTSRYDVMTSRHDVLTSFDDFWPRILTNRARRGRARQRSGVFIFFIAAKSNLHELLYFTFGKRKDTWAGIIMKLLLTGMYYLPEVYFSRHFSQNLCKHLRHLGLSRNSLHMPHLRKSLLKLLMVSLSIFCNLTDRLF